MKQGETSTIGISKKTKSRLQRLYFKEKVKETISNYDDLINNLIDNYGKGGKN